MKNEFLVVYDYGQGGVWAYLHASSADEIESLFPELKVVTERPGWMTPELEGTIRKNRTVDIGERQAGFLAEILENRKRRG